MTYAEKKQHLVASAAYRRATRVIAVACVGYAAAIDGVILLSGGSPNSRIPGGTGSVRAGELLYWAVVAGLMFLVCLALLRFVAPALMTEARLRKLPRAL